MREREDTNRRTRLLSPESVLGNPGYPLIFHLHLLP